jgi:hypothetical protein
MGTNFRVSVIPALGLSLACVVFAYRPACAQNVTLVNNTGSPTVTEGGTASVTFTLTNNLTLDIGFQSGVMVPGSVTGDSTDTPIELNRTPVAWTRSSVPGLCRRYEDLHTQKQGGHSKPWG